MFIPPKPRVYNVLTAPKTVMTMAEALVEDMVSNVLKKIRKKSHDQEKTIIGIIDDVKERLVTSGAANNDSPIIGQLDTMKNKFCESYLRDESVRKQAEKEQIEKLWKNDDVVATIKQFKETYEATNKVKVSNQYLDVNVVKAGDNMQSGIVRYKFDQLSTDGKGSKKKSVILKIPSLSALPYDILKTTNMFDREAHFYRNVLPELYRLSKCEPFAPILHAATPIGALVLEDLTVDGFKPGDRMKPFTIQEAMVILSTLAKFHAASYKYLETLGEDDPNKSLIAADQPGLMALMGRTRKTTFDNFCQLVKPHLSDQLYQNILKLENEILADPVDKTNPEKTIVTVITHADLRANNLLLKHDDKGNALEAKLLDWQSSRRGNPAVDLIYFFVTCVKIDQFQEHDSILRNHYLRELNDNLRSMRITSSYDVDKDLEAHKYFYLHVISTYWQKIMSLGRSGEVSEEYVSGAVKWLQYLETIKIL